MGFNSGFKGLKTEIRLNVKRQTKIQSMLDIETNHLHE